MPKTVLDLDTIANGVLGNNRYSANGFSKVAAGKPALVKFGVQVDTIQALALTAMGAAVKDILKEALDVDDPRTSRPEDVAAVLRATMTQLVNAVWTAGNNVANSVMPPTAGHHFRMRATRHKDANGKDDAYITFFVCKVKSSGAPDSKLEPLI